MECSMQTESAPKPGTASTTAGPDPKKTQQPDGATPDSPPAAKVPEPTQPLPTDRITFEKQLMLLRAYVAATDQGTKAASNEDVGAVIKMQGSTVSLGNAFFVKNGFLTRSGRGYVPAKEVLDYKLAYEWDAATSGIKL